MQIKDKQEPVIHITSDVQVISLFATRQVAELILDHRTAFTDHSLHH